MQVLPIENSMLQPQKFLTAKPCGVLNFAMTLVVSMYTLTGFLGYLRFGNATAGSITLNLPDDLYVLHDEYDFVSCLTSAFNSANSSPSTTYL